MPADHLHRRILIQVWAALLVLLLLTWWVAHLDLGAWNAIAAMSIAVVKMLLVVLIFMRVRITASVWCGFLPPPDCFGCSSWSR